MADSSINKSIVVSSQQSDETKPTLNSFPDAVKELGKALHENYPKRTSNLTNENELGLIEIDVLNDYMIKNFGYKYETLTQLQTSKREYVVSVKGFGVEKLIELIKGIQASFEQTEIPNRLGHLLRR